MQLDEKITGTGIPELDDILGGGIPRDRFFLVQGDPGAGKTTLGLQFLLAGAAQGETALYISLSETRDEINAVAASHGWSLEGVALFELSALEQSGSLEQDASLFETSEIELQETTRTLLAHIEKVKPLRVVFDSLSEVRLLSQSSLRYRRQLLALKQYFTGKQITVLLLDDRTSEEGDPQLQSLANGVLTMEQIAPLYGEDRRRLRVVKLRGRKFRGDTTISSSVPAVWWCSRGWWRRSTAPSSSARRSPAGSARSTSCSAVGSIAAPAPSSSDRPGRANRPWRCSTRWPPRGAETARRSTPLTKRCPRCSPARRGWGWI